MHHLRQGSIREQRFSHARRRFGKRETAGGVSLAASAILCFD